MVTRYPLCSSLYVNFTLRQIFRKLQLPHPWHCVLSAAGAAPLFLTHPSFKSKRVHMQSNSRIQHTRCRIFSKPVNAYSPVSSHTRLYWRAGMRALQHNGFHISGTVPKEKKNHLLFESLRTWHRHVDRLNQWWQSANTRANVQ